MVQRPVHQLLPEEDALDDPDEDDEIDPTLPGDLWFDSGDGVPPKQRAPFCVVYSGPGRRGSLDRWPAVSHAKANTTWIRKKDTHEWQLSN